MGQKILGYNTVNGREHPYGMSTSVMASLHNSASTFNDPLVSTFSPLQGSGSGINNLGRNTQPPGFATHLPAITTNFVAVLRQQMDDSNHRMIGVLAQKMGAIFNALVQSATQTNQKNA